MVSIAAKKSSKKVVKKETKAKKPTISLEILNTEVLNFIVSVVILALLVFYLVPTGGANTDAAPKELETNCKTLCSSLESQGYEFSRINEKGSCFCTQEATIPDFENNRTITAKIERELGVISNLESEEGIQQQPMQLQ